MCVEAARARQELLVRTDFDDLSALHPDDAGAGTDGRQAMGDDDDRAAPDDRAHVILNDPLAVVVERRGRLVENEDARIGRERASDRDALTLTAGQVRPRSSIIVS
jgi:hypothetical protein